MTPLLAQTLQMVTTWILPVVIAVTLHEAAHGFVAHRLGDDTAWRLGRVSFNPLKHIDPFGTVLLPGFLLLAHAPFLFGYAKPVPINFRKLGKPRRDMVLVALAGPATNIALAFIAASLLHVVGFVPHSGQMWLTENLENALVLNVILAVFNMLPVPPLDGGRVLVGVLPRVLAKPLAEIEPYGVLILIGLLILPMVAARAGLDLNVIGWLLAAPVRAIIQAIASVTGTA